MYRSSILGRGHWLPCFVRCRGRFISQQLNPAELGARALDLLLGEDFRTTLIELTARRAFAKVPAGFDFQDGPVLTAVVLRQCSVGSQACLNDLLKKELNRETTWVACQGKLHLPLIQRPATRPLAAIGLPSRN